MSSGHKRQIVESLVVEGRCSGRAAGRHFGLPRSTFFYEAKEPNPWLSPRKSPNVVGRAPQQDCRPRLRTDIMYGPGTLCMTRLFAEESCGCSR
jgi:hypothetical protein